MSTSSIESIDITSTPTPTTKRNSTFSDEIVKAEHVCQKPGCEEKFHSAELFAIHQQKHKHEMKLRIGGEMTFMDDTPTPTRFLKFIGGNEYQDPDHPSPFDPLFKKVTDDNCDNLTMAIAKDRRYLNEMIPNGLQTRQTDNNQHSNISTSSSSTLYGPNGNGDYQTDMPFPRTYQSTDLLPFGTELSIDTDPSNNLLIQANLKTSSSDSLQSDSISTTASISLDTNMSLISDTPTKKKRGRKPILDEDPVEKRKRYLERNRAAATRCRNKKKVWVNGLEKNINNLVDENAHLKRENILLKSELRKYSQFKDPLANLSFQIRPINSGLEGDQEGLTGYLSAATLNNPSISQASILRPHPGLLLPMGTSLNPELYSGNHLAPTTNQ